MSTPRRVEMVTTYVDSFTGVEFVRPTYVVVEKPLEPNVRGDGHDEARWWAARDKRARRAARNLQ